MYCLGLIFYDWKETWKREKEKRISKWSWSKWEQKELDKDHRLVLNTEGLSVPGNCGTVEGASASAQVPSLSVGSERHSALHSQGSANGPISIMIVSFLLWSRKRRCEKVHSHLFLHLAILPRGFLLRPCRSRPLVTGSLPSDSSHHSYVRTMVFAAHPPRALKPCHPWEIQVFAFHRAPHATHSSWIPRKLSFFVFPWYLPILWIS